MFQPRALLASLANRELLAYGEYGVHVAENPELEIGCIQHHDAGDFHYNAQISLMLLLLAFLCKANLLLPLPTL